MTRCSACHHYSLPLSKNHNAADWGRIVNRMAAKKGANLSEEEMSQIIRFLTTYRGA